MKRSLQKFNQTSPRRARKCKYRLIRDDDLRVPEDLLVHRKAGLHDLHDALLAGRFILHMGHGLVVRGIKSVAEALNRKHPVIREDGQKVLHHKLDTPAVGFVLTGSGKRAL